MASRTLPIIVTSGGVLLVYSGIKGKSVLGETRGLLHGKSPKDAPPVNALTAQGGSGSTGGGIVTASSSALVNAAMQGNGHPYVWGGAPGPDGSGGWDCSSFMNYVIGVQLGMAIPGFPAGTYHGQEHGPNTVSWLTWSGCATVSEANVQPGDLVVGMTHMGMVTGPGEYMSAHDPADGTSVGSLMQFPDLIKSFRRLKA
jgi:cell wall-associated NlpC family hydrolase